MPFHLPFHPNTADLRLKEPAAIDLKLRLDSERRKDTIFRCPLGLGQGAVFPTSSISILARLYRIARLVLLVDHHTMRVK